MNREERSEHDTLSVRRDLTGAAVGIFDRAVKTPVDEIIEREEAEEDALPAGEERLRAVRFLQWAFHWACCPFSPAKMWGLAFVLDLRTLHGGRSIAEVAREADVSRAAISNACRDIIKRWNLPPPPQMRSEMSAVRSREARRAVVRRPRIANKDNNNNHE